MPLPGMARMTRIALLATGAGLATLGVLHLAGLPTFYTAFDINYDDESLLQQDASTQRYGGTLGGANVYGNILVFPIVVACFTWITKKRWWQLFLTPLMFVGIMSSGCRLGLLSAAGATAVFIVAGRARLVIRLLAITVALLALLINVVWLSKVSAYNMGRLEQLGEGDLRLQKSAIAIEALNSSMRNLALGTSGYQLVLDRQNENQFSDNSLLQIATSIGVPATFVFILVVARLVWRSVRRWSVALIVTTTIILATLLFNNSILWNVWLFFGCATFWLLENEWNGASSAGPLDRRRRRSRHQMTFRSPVVAR